MLAQQGRPPRSQPLARRRPRAHRPATIGV